MRFAGYDGEVSVEMLQPQPPAWPACGNCHTPYVLRRAFMFSDTGISATWAWMRDCEKPKSKACKEAAPLMFDAEGEVPPSGR